MEEARLKLKEAQKIFLKVFAKHPGNFALSGGTALELYYLHHRNSLDLDFFSPAYNFAQINTIISEFRKSIKCSIKLENEFILANWAKVRFYNVTLKGLKRPLKLDSVEDVIFTRPKIKKFNEVDRKDGLRPGSLFNKVCDSVGDGFCLSGTRSGDDKEGSRGV